MEAFSTPGDLNQLQNLRQGHLNPTARPFFPVAPPAWANAIHGPAFQPYHQGPPPAPTYYGHHVFPHHPLYHPPAPQPTTLPSSLPHMRGLFESAAPFEHFHPWNAPFQAGSYEPGYMPSPHYHRDRHNQGHPLGGRGHGPSQWPVPVPVYGQQYGPTHEPIYGEPHHGPVYMAEPVYEHTSQPAPRDPAVYDPVYNRGAETPADHFSEHSEEYTPDLEYYNPSPEYASHREAEGGLTDPLIDEEPHGTATDTFDDDADHPSGTEVTATATLRLAASSSAPNVTGGSSARGRASTQ
ncbi:hypothetical protein M426DRAFT_68145 [Hypoxylon sp. CI-4A]|nr:hypothetical protein M426DRAFT_68145 [Hypoxylon sp. CI-4A]